MKLSDLAPELQERVTGELRPDEKVEWIGQPVPRFFSPEATVLFIFGIFWNVGTFLSTRFLIGFNEAGVEFEIFAIAMVAFGFPITIAGFVLLSAPVWMYLMSHKTAYVITNSRVICFDKVWYTTVRSFDSSKLINAHVKESRKEMGDIVLHSGLERAADGTERKVEFKMDNVADVKNVYSRIQSLAASTNSPAIEEVDREDKEPVESLEINDLSPRLREIVDEQLDSGEKIEWIGQPTFKFYGLAPALALGLGIPWVFFAIYLYARCVGFLPANMKQHVLFFTSVATLAILPGLSIILKFFRIRRGTCYVISDHKVIVIDGRKKKSVIKIYRPDQLTGLFRVENRHQFGNVLFDFEASYDSEGGTKYIDMGFMEIPDVRRVHKKIQRLVRRWNRGLTTIEEVNG